MFWVSVATTVAYNYLSLLQGSAGQVSKVDTDGGDLPEDLNIGFSGKGPGIYGSFATGKPATRGAPASQVSFQILLKCCRLCVAICHMSHLAW